MLVAWQDPGPFLGGRGFSFGTPEIAVVLNPGM